MSKDETVDGARIAAQILDALPSSHRERLKSNIKQVNPKTLARIEANVFSFEDLATLTTQSIQILMQAVAHKDLVAALIGASQKILDQFLNNLSPRKAQILTEDLAALPSLPEREIQEARARILRKVEELRKAGLVRSAVEQDIWV